MTLTNSSKALAAAAFLFLFVFSCNDNETDLGAKGNIEFSFSTSNLINGRIAANAASIIVSVKGNTGVTVYDKRKINLFDFSGELISEPISFKPGNYSLTEFLILDKDDNVIYATPLEGSDLAHLVADPLPINFTIAKDQTLKLAPQVVATEAIAPASFGYSTFTFNIVNTFNFYIAVFAYNETSKNFELTNSSLSISSANVVTLSKELPGVTNTIILKDNGSSYTLTISKSNYATYSKTFTIDQLKTFNTENKPLIVSLLKQSSRDGLVAEYLFDGNSNDTSGKNHHGTAQGATLSTDRKGVPLSAYAFNGANQNYVTIADNSDLNFTSSQNYSISLWVLANPTQTNESNINDIFRKWSGDAQGYPFGVSYTNEQQAIGQRNKFLSVRYDGSSCGNTPASYSPAASTNVYHHIVVTKEGSAFRQYVDNILVDEITDNTSCTTTNNSPITIGARGSLARFFTGKIDDIRVFNRKISTAEIDALFKE